MNRRLQLSIEDIIKKSSETKSTEKRCHLCVVWCLSTTEENTDNCLKKDNVHIYSGVNSLINEIIILKLYFVFTQVVFV